jgi:DNA repair protein RecO (recombination protein O)
MGRPPITTEGIKLKEHLFRESDVSLLVFTKDRATLRAVAPGLKRSRKRFPGSIRKLCFYELILAKGKKDYYMISGARFLEGYEEISRDFIGYCAADYILQVIQYFYPENMASSYIFNSLKMYLQALASGKEFGSAIKWMELRILSDSGFLSDLTTCSSCTKVFRKDEKRYFHRESGRAYCKGCRKSGKFQIFHNDINDIKENINRALDSGCGEFSISSQKDSDFYNRITTEVIVEKLGFVPKALVEIVSGSK